MGIVPAGYKEVCCEDCGESLGYEAAAVELVREYWQHPRCPERIARQLQISRADYDRAHAVAAVTIAGAYPDFPNNVIGDERFAKLRALRANIAAGAALEALATAGRFTFNTSEGDR
jgi:hypothetical protein